MKEQLKSLLAGIAPSLATALGGPLAGAAVSALAKKYVGDENAAMPDIVEKVREAVELSKTDRRTRIELVELDNSFKVEMKRLSNELEGIQAADRSNARGMIEFLGNADKQYYLTLIAVILWALLSYFIMDEVITGKDELPNYAVALLGRLLGTLDGLLLASWAFWFGTTRKDKDSNK